MGGPGGSELLLFVAGLPGEATPQETQATFPRWVLGRSVEPDVPQGSQGQDRASVAGQPAERTALAEEAPWHFPPETIKAINLVLAAALRAGTRVTVVDVNRPGIYQPLVQQWVGTNDVFPLMIRGDGSRIEGIENFTPRTIRAFVTRP